MPSLVTSPDDPALASLCRELASRADELDDSGEWPAEQLSLCREYGVYSWFAGREWGGQSWSQEDILRGYLAMAGACLTTTFVLTQREGACRRIEGSGNHRLKEMLLPGLTSGELFVTVGISHLTTSRRYAARPVLRADRHPAGGVVLNGYSPWVTGADHADYVMVGATFVNADGTAADDQLLAIVPTTSPGANADEPARLVSLSASHTGKFLLENVHLVDEFVIAGPTPNVMSTGPGATTGGLGTSTLALGLTRAAIEVLSREAERRAELAAPCDALAADSSELEESLFAAMRGQPACSNDELRQRANSLVLRSTQAALAAAKGAGFVAGHPAGRWCREALFFLVWSCPQPVLSANLCELAGILD